jgi:hypothetical protein
MGKKINLAFLQTPYASERELPMKEIRKPISINPAWLGSKKVSQRAE